MRAGAKGAHAHTCDTREKGTRRRQGCGGNETGSRGETFAEDREALEPGGILRPVRNDGIMLERTIGYLLIPESHLAMRRR